MSDDESEPKSINQILREYTDSRLYVHPIAWTEAQPRLLKIHFTKESASKQTKSTKRKGKGSGSGDLSLAELSLEDKDAIVKAVDGLSSSSHRVQKSNLTEIFRRHGWNLQQSSRLPFRFDKSVVDKLCTNAVYCNDSNDISVVYVSLKVIQRLRIKYLGRNDSQKDSSTGLVPPMVDSSKKPSSSEAATDPYISALLISLAQETHQKRVNSKSSHVNDSVKTHAIALPETNAAQIYLYTAAFSPHQLLYHLDYPNDPGDWDPVSISWSTIGLRDAERVATRLSRYIQKTISPLEP